MNQSNNRLASKACSECNTPLFEVNRLSNTVNIRSMTLFSPLIKVQFTGRHWSNKSLGIRVIDPISPSLNDAPDGPDTTAIVYCIILRMYCIVILSAFCRMSNKDYEWMNEWMNDCVKSSYDLTLFIAPVAPERISNSSGNPSGNPGGPALYVDERRFEVYSTYRICCSTSLMGVPVWHLSMVGFGTGWQWLLVAICLVVFVILCQQHRFCET